jgi:hypothetical protein
MKKRRSIQFQVRIESVMLWRYYEFHLAAANVQGVVRGRLVQDDACEAWPLMLKQEDDEYLFISADELVLIRETCQSCGSSHFRPGDAARCFDCGSLAEELAHG